MGLIQCRTRTGSEIAVDDSETSVRSSEYEGQTPTCEEIGYDDSFLEQAQADTNTLDAFEQQEPSPPADAREHYTWEYDNTDRYAPEEVAEINDMPACDVTTVMTGRWASKSELARRRSDAMMPLRQSLVDQRDDSSLLGDIASAMSEDDPDWDEASDRVEASILDSGHLMVGFDDLANDIDGWLEKGNMPAGVAEELLARNCVHHAMYPPIYGEMRFLNNPGEQRDRREAEVIRTATAYKEQYENMRAYLDPLEEYKSQFAEAMDMLWFAAACYDVAGSVLLLRGTSGMGTKWKLGVGSKLAGYPSALAAVESIPWAKISGDGAIAAAWTSCTNDSDTEREQEVCDNMMLGGDKIQAEMKRLVTLGAKLERLARE